MATIKSKNVNAYNNVNIQGDNLAANDAGFRQSTVKVVQDKPTAPGSSGYTTEGVKGPN